MKKILSILLVMLLVAAILPTAALADGPVVVLSNQKLRVNGKPIECERYNIDGRNYFKLRDLAALLDGTGSQFNVDYDTAAKQMVVTTGVPYTTPNGTELKIGVDNSATTQVSTQSLAVDGQLIEGLTVYNIGGTNFFQLKELGETLGFKVAYDTPSRTMIVISKASSNPTEWLMEETFNSSNTGEQTHMLSNYDANGNVLSTLYESGSYREETANRYDEMGYVQEYTYSYTSEYGGETYQYSSSTVYGYNLWGQLESLITTTSDGSGSEEFYDYDDDGNLVQDYIHSGDYRTVVHYTYDAMGNLIKSVTEVNGETYGAVEYAWDEDGNMLRCWSTGNNGSPGYSYDYEYADGLTVKVSYTSGEYGYVTVYTYDEQGNLLRQDTDSTDWDSFNEYTYDEEGRMLTSIYYDGCDAFTTVSTYDEEGRLVHEEHSSPDGEEIYDYTYDEEGRLLTETYNGSDFQSVTQYTYDRAESRQTRSTFRTYPPASELVLSCEEMTLALLDVERISYSFMPYSCVPESVTWSSSDGNVVDVDEYGNVFTVGVGTAVVTATSENGLTASCTVTVVAEKFHLYVSPIELELQVGETLPLRCIAECVGSWKSCSLRFINGDESMISLSWGEWLSSSEIDLKVTGLATGETTIVISQFNPDTQEVYDAVAIFVKVTDTVSAPKG